jgi:uncharacterized protein YqeY
VSAAALKERLRGDLKAAMQAKAAAEVRLLRTLIAALDNAEAVPGASKYVPRAFGETGTEVARLQLDGAAVEGILAAEIDTRLAAAADYDRHGASVEAQRLRDEADLIARYRAG